MRQQPHCLQLVVTSSSWPSSVVFQSSRFSQLKLFRASRQLFNNTGSWSSWSSWRLRLSESALLELGKAVEWALRVGIGAIQLRCMLDFQSIYVQIVCSRKFKTHTLILHTCNASHTTWLINSNLNGRGLTSYTHAFRCLVVKCCVFGGEKGKADWGDEKVSWCDAGRLIAPDWQLGVMAQCAAGSFTTSQGRLNPIWMILIAGNVSVKSTQQAHNLATEPDASAGCRWCLPPHKAEIVSMLESNCYFIQRTVLHYHSSHVATSWQIWHALEGNVFWNGFFAEKTEKKSFPSLLSLTNFLVNFLTSICNEWNFGNTN